MAASHVVTRETVTKPQPSQYWKSVVAISSASPQHHTAQVGRLQDHGNGSIITRQNDGLMKSLFPSSL